MKDIANIRRQFLKALSDRGLLIGYQANIAMLLHDKYGIKDHDKRNNAAIDILNLILDGNLKRADKES